MSLVDSVLLARADAQARAFDPDREFRRPKPGPVEEWWRLFIAFIATLPDDHLPLLEREGEAIAQAARAEMRARQTRSAA